jgi:hypothetical protein
MQRSGCNFLDLHASEPLAVTDCPMVTFASAKFESGNFRSTHFPDDVGSNFCA